MSGSWSHCWAGRCEEFQDAVEESVAGVVEVLEEQDGGDRRQHHGQVDQQPQIPLGVPELVEHDGDDERHREAQHERQDREEQGVAPGLPERGVVEDVAEVGPAGPGRRAVLRLLEGQEELPDHRVPGEEGEAEDGSDQEAVRRDVAAQGAHELLTGGVRPGGAWVVPGWRCARLPGGQGGGRHGLSSVPVRSLTDGGMRGRARPARPPHVRYWFARTWLTCCSAVSSSLSMSASLLVRTADIALSRIL